MLQNKLVSWSAASCSCGMQEAAGWQTEGERLKMKRKLVAALMAALMVVSLAACGEKSESGQEPKKETQTEKKETQTVEKETQTQQAEGTEGEGTETDAFTLLDVTSDMIQAGVYAVKDDGTELVFSMFTAPDDTPMASLFVFPPEGEGDVICGTYTGETETDEDGITWSLMNGTDVYTDQDFTIGFGEAGNEVYIFDANGDPYEGQYLTNGDTITYMGTAVALLGE